jgi:hypothetical protein
VLKTGHYRLEGVLQAYRVLSAFTQTRANRWFIGKQEDTTGKRFDIARLDQESIYAIGDELRDTADAGGHDWETARHRFQQAHWQAFVVGRQ